MGDCRKCQTSTASPAKPGGLPVMLETRLIQMFAPAYPRRCEFRVGSFASVDRAQRDAAIRSETSSDATKLPQHSIELTDKRADP